MYITISMIKKLVLCVFSTPVRPQAFLQVIHYGGLRSVIYSCRSVHKNTLRHAAIALANLSLYGGSEDQAEMIRQHVADWLFPLAFSSDDVIHYYACLAIVVLSTNRELSQAVEESGTLNLVLPFIQTHTPREFAACEPSHLQVSNSKVCCFSGNKLPFRSIQMCTCNYLLFFISSMNELILLLTFLSCASMNCETCCLLI